MGLWRLDIDQTDPDTRIDAGPVWRMTFSPDGAILATGNNDGAVRLWHSADGSPRDTRHSRHTGRVLAMAFSADGEILATSGDDRTVRLSAITGQDLGGFPTNHPGGVFGLAFSPDPHLLATSSADGSVRLWRADTGDSVAEPLTGHTGVVRSVAFTPDGQRLTSAGVDQTVRTWPAVAKPEMLCDKLSSDISPDEWRAWVSDDADIGPRPLCGTVTRQYV